MKESRYMKKYSMPDKPGASLLFSTKKASKVLLNPEYMDKMDKDRLDPKDKATLAGLGFLVEDRQEEKKEMAGILDKANREQTKVNAVVVLNLQCNLDCVYCFEGKMKGSRYMTRDTADLLVEYFSNKALAEKKRLDITFYGGEPLLAPSFALLKSISKRLRARAREKGAEFSFFLITNGTLLTRKKVDELVPLGLTGAQVTLDGPRETHDRARPYVKGRGSYSRIIHNLKEIDGKIELQLGGNYTKDNYKEFPGLLDDLAREGITPDKVHIMRFSPVMQTKGEFSLPDFHDGCMSINEPWFREADLFLREEILKRGYPIPKVKPGSCMVEFTNDFVVHYDGSIYKCPAFIGRKELAVGNLWDGIKDYRESHKLGYWKKDECLDCEYLPICFGGCRYMKLMRDGNFDDVDCKKEYYDAVLESYVLQDIKYQAREKERDKGTKGQRVKGQWPMAKGKRRKTEG
ncbi:MAG: geopeptide radical SAM maturase [Nitrospinae bacterium]|nr:geopeptide radical SAM maturase [Nitrospinota bacterium]